MNKSKARPRLKEFLNWCLDGEFEVCFWSSVKKYNLVPRINFIRDKVPPLLENYLQFGQTMCKESAYKDKAFSRKSFFLKPLVHMCQWSPKLVACGATEEDTLLIDDSPYKNVLNNHFNVFHLSTCTLYSEANLKKSQILFLLQVLQILVFKLRSSRKNVSKFLEAYKSYR